MTRTEELLKLAEAANENATKDDWGSRAKFELQYSRFTAAANPETIKQLCLRLQKLEALVRVQNEVINAAAADANIYYHQDVVAQINNAIAAFNKFEGGE